MRFACIAAFGMELYETVLLFDLILVQLLWFVAKSSVVIFFRGYFVY